MEQRVSDLEDGQLTVEGLVRGHEDVVYGHLNGSLERQMLKLPDEVVLCRCDGTLGRIASCLTNLFPLDGADPSRSTELEMARAMQACARSGKARFKKYFPINYK